MSLSLMPSVDAPSQPVFQPIPAFSMWQLTSIVDTRIIPFGPFGEHLMPSAALRISYALAAGTPTTKSVSCVAQNTFFTSPKADLDALSSQQKAAATKTQNSHSLPYSPLPQEVFLEKMIHDAIYGISRNWQHTHPVVLIFAITCSSGCYTSQREEIVRNDQDIQTCVRRSRDNLQNVLISSANPNDLAAGGISVIAACQGSTHGRINYQCITHLKTMSYYRDEVSQHIGVQKFETNIGEIVIGQSVVKLINQICPGITF